MASCIWRDRALGGSPGCDGSARIPITTGNNSFYFRAGPVDGKPGVAYDEMTMDATYDEMTMDAMTAVIAFM